MTEKEKWQSHHDVIKSQLDSFNNSKYNLRHARNAKIKDSEQHCIDTILKTVEQYIRRNGEIYDIITKSDERNNNFQRQFYFKSSWMKNFLILRQLIY